MGEAGVGFVHDEKVIVSRVSIEGLLYLVVEGLKGMQ